MVETPLRISKTFLVYEDHTGTLNSYDVLQPAIQNQFKDQHEYRFRQGSKTLHYWVQFQIHNPNQEEVWYLSAKYPHGEMEVYTFGHELIRKEASLKSRVPVSQLRIPPDSTQSLLVKYESQSIHTLDFELRTPELWSQKTVDESSLLSGLVGFYLALILYNFFLYLSLRDPVYLYYLFFALINTHINLSVVNFPASTYQFLVDNNALHAAFAYYRPLAPLSLVLFTRYFLQTRVCCPRLDRILLSYVGGLALLTFAHFFISFNTLTPIADAYYSVGIILLLGTAAHRIKHRFRPALYYFWAVSFFLISMLIFLASVENLLPTNYFTLNIILLGHAFEMLFMSLALAAKIKILQEDKARAEGVAALKGRLLSVISHDIANPLSIVKGVAYYLGLKNPHDTFMEKISRSVSIIENILNFVLRTETVGQGNRLVLETIPVKEVYEDLNFLFEGKAKEKNLTLKFDLSNPDLRVYAEKISLTNQILGNLLSNAIKFSFEGSTIEIRAHASSLHKTVIAISDTGKGMSKETLESIWNPMTNKSQLGTKQECGHAIGLPIVKSFLEACGGTIAVKSIPFELDPERSGTTFTITLASIESTSS